MNFKIYTPQNELIKKFIERYIFIEEKELDYTQMTCFPNTNYCLGILLNKSLKTYHSKRIVFGPSDSTHHYITGIYNAPIQLIFTGSDYRELCVDFKPLALQYLNMEPLKKNQFAFDSFARSKRFNINLLAAMATSFFKENIDNPAEELDAYFLSVFQSEILREYEVLNNEQFSSIGELQAALCMSERSTYRFFQQQLGITPYQFLSIQRFRNCTSLLYTYAQLSDIAYSTDLTDNSHLNKLFKKYAGISPSAFKKQVSNFNDLLIQL